MTIQARIDEVAASRDWQETDFETFRVTLPESALTAGYAGSLAVEIDLLTRHIMDSLNNKLTIATAERELAADELATAKTRIATLVTESITHKAEMGVKERIIEQLKARTVSSSEVEELQAAAAMLGQQLAEQRALAEELAEQLSKLDGVNERATESSSQVADLTARLNHANSKIEKLEGELFSNQLVIKQATSKVNLLTNELQETVKKLKLHEESLSRADKAKQNALASQEAAFKEQMRGLSRIEAGKSVISAAELAELRQKAAERDEAKADIEHLKQKAAQENIEFEEAKKLADELKALNEELDYTSQQQKCVLEEQHLLLKDRARKLDYAELTIQYLNQQAIYKNDFGRLSVMSLDPTNIKSSDSHAIHPDKPICWWLNSNGLGCIVFLSAEKDDTGEHYLIFPSLMIDFENESKNVMDLIMPPKDTWPAIIEVIDKLDNKEMLDSMARGEAAANLYSSIRNPDAENAMQQAIAIKNKREALQRQFQNKQAQKAAKKAAKKKPVKPTRAG